MDADCDQYTWDGVIFKKSMGIAYVHPRFMKDAVSTQNKIMSNTFFGKARGARLSMSNKLLILLVFDQINT